MSTAMERRAIFFLLHTLLWLLLTTNICDSIEIDIQCLKGIKQSLKDPYNYLSSWNFNNKTRGFICDFNGIECSHPGIENKVIDVNLASMSLQGQFPLALKNCTTLTGLDLSNNSLSGPLPHDISVIVPFVTSLNLSYNKISGDIPPSLSNCTYLNALHLQHNEFTGQIPEQLGNLSQLTAFSVADNLLSGKIPSLVREMPFSSFANNSQLCGKPLGACKDPPKRSHTRIIIIGSLACAFVAVIVVSFLFYHRVTIIIALRKLFGFGLCFHTAARENIEQVSNMELGIRRNRWAKSTRGSKGIKVSMFEKLVPKMRLIDLMKATDNFSKDNVISSGRAGTMYKAVLPDGSFIAVKRMEDSHRSRKRFISETTVLGSIRHRNVVPLLGFCIARKERLLVYKYMSRGTLYQQLHKANGKANVTEWPSRVRIAIGVARGLVWLHHNCNPCIIHHDISSKHILLDEEYEPVISDFKSVRLMGTTINSIFGDVGYVAPEYMRKFEAIPKGDVYSFGLVLLELVTGNEPTRAASAPRNFKGNLVEWIAHLSNNSRLSKAIDKSLIGMGLDDDIFEFIRVACSCVVSDPDKRPTMFEAYLLLQAIGKRYGFTDDDEIQTPPNTIDTDYAYLITMPQQILEIH